MTHRYCSKKVKGFAQPRGFAVDVLMSARRAAFLFVVVSFLTWASVCSAEAFFCFGGGIMMRRFCGAKKETTA
jgi:hypothetical protein